MTMVDGLVRCGGGTTVSCLQLDKANIFCRSGFFTEPGIIENIAQTAALGNGFEALQSGTKHKAGFIGAIKRLTIFELPKDTDTLETTVTVLHKLMNATVVSGEVRVGEKCIARGQLNIFLQDT